MISYAPACPTPGALYAWAWAKVCWRKAWSGREWARGGSARMAAARTPTRFPAPSLNGELPDGSFHQKRGDLPWPPTKCNGRDFLVPNFVGRRRNCCQRCLTWRWNGFYIRQPDVLLIHHIRSSSFFLSFLGYCCEEPVMISPYLERGQKVVEIPRRASWAKWRSSLPAGGWSSSSGMSVDDYRFGRESIAGLNWRLWCSPWSWSIGTASWFSCLMNPSLVCSRLYWWEEERKVKVRTRARQP